MIAAGIAPAERTTTYMHIRSLLNAIRKWKNPPKLNGRLIQVREHGAVATFLITLKAVQESN